MSDTQFYQDNGIYDNVGNLILKFDSYVDNSYHNSNGIAYEPVEDGSFTSDSKQDTPFIISVTAIFVIKDRKDPRNSNNVLSVFDIQNKIADLTKSATVVSVLLQPFVKNDSSNNEYWQYGKFYQNICLASFDYQNTPDQLELRANLTFQQIRLTNTQYTNVQNTANPTDSSTVNQGQVQPESDTSTIYSVTGKVPSPL